MSISYALELHLIVSICQSTTLVLTQWIPVTVCYKAQSLRDDIKSSGTFAIFTRLKIERGDQGHITEKITTKIKTVEDIDVKITQNDLGGNRDRK